MAETVWVLKSFHGFSAVEITPVLQEILRNDHIQAREKGALLAALDFFSTKKVDFIDALLAVHMEMEGISEVYSFDTHFDRFSEIKRLIPGD